MRKLILLGVLLALVGGCKRAKVAINNPPPQQPQPGQVQPDQQPDQPKVHAPTGVVVNPGGGGGSGGAAQAVRKAALRARMMNDMNQLRILIEQFNAEQGRMPTLEELTASLPSNLGEQVKEKMLALTGIRQREGIWAYTTKDQSTTGEHLVLSNSGIERMTPQALNEKLKQQ